MKVIISAERAPAIGDVRRLKFGDVVILRSGWMKRHDAARYADAVTAAVMRGADVQNSQG